MSRYRDQITAAVTAVTITSPTRYAWLGRTSRPLRASFDAELDDGARLRFLADGLSNELYASFYRHGRPVPARWGEIEPVAADPRLGELLSHANPGSGGWDPGWTVLRIDGSEGVVAKAGVRVRISLDDCRPEGGTVRAGDTVSVRLPKELPFLKPGFYTAVSEAPADPKSWASLVRVYWNITHAGAAALVSRLAGRLNHRHAPFQLKVADHPARFARCDAGLLYLPSETFGALRDSLCETADELERHLRPGIPAFTLELATGVGVAEVAGGSLSFGERRCALLADGITRGYVRGLTRIDERVDAVASCFADDGVLLDAPYLEPALAGCHVLE